MDDETRFRKALQSVEHVAWMVRHIKDEVREAGLEDIADNLDHCHSVLAAVARELIEGTGELGYDPSLGLWVARPHREGA